MRRAWEMKKDRRTGWMFTFAQCLKYAWREAKQSAARWQDHEDRRLGRGKYSREAREAREAQIQRKTTSMAHMADALVAYYSNNRYNGD